MSLMPALNICKRMSSISTTSSTTDLYSAGLDAASGRRISKYARLAILFRLLLRLEHQASFRFTASSLPTQYLFPRAPTCLCCLPLLSASESCPFPPHHPLTQSIFVGLDAARRCRIFKYVCLATCSVAPHWGANISRHSCLSYACPKSADLSMLPASNIRKRMLSISVASPTASVHVRRA